MVAIIIWREDLETNTQKVTAEKRGKVTTYKTQTATYKETIPVNTLIMDLKPPELWESKGLLFQPLNLWCFVMPV